MRMRTVVISLAIVTVFSLPALAAIVGFNQQQWNNVVGSCDILGQHYRETSGNIGTALTREVGNTCYRLGVRWSWYHEDFGWMENQKTSLAFQTEVRNDLGGITSIGWTRHRGSVIPNGQSEQWSTWRQIP